MWESWGHTTLLQSLAVGQWCLPISPFLGGLRRTKVHTSTAAQKYCCVNCFMPSLGFLHLIYNGNCVTVQPGLFPALPSCDYLKISQPLHWKSLTAIESSKENKEARSPNFPQLCEIRVQSSTPFVEQDAQKKKKNLLIPSRTIWLYFILVVIAS